MKAWNLFTSWATASFAIRIVFRTFITRSFRLILTTLFLICFT
jgi:hypothetical protein